MLPGVLAPHDDPVEHASAIVTQPQHEVARAVGHGDPLLRAIVLDARRESSRRDQGHNGQDQTARWVGTHSVRPEKEDRTMPVNVDGVSRSLPQNVQRLWKQPQVTGRM